MARDPLRAATRGSCGVMRARIDDACAYAARARPADTGRSGLDLAISPSSVASCFLARRCPVERAGVPRDRARGTGLASGRRVRRACPRSCCPVYVRVDDVDESETPLKRDVHGDA